MRFLAADGTELDGEIDEVASPRATVVVCHAHPRMQGTMRSPLLLALRDVFVERGTAVVRFNFRGVGASGGEFGDGLDEVEDAHGALALARDRFPTTPVVLVGWSFGGAVAIRAAAEDGAVAACVAVAPSVVAREGISVGLPDPSEVDLRTELLIVCGANDDVVSPADCRAWAEGSGARYVEIPAANHFFWAKYEPLTAEVVGWVDERLDHFDRGGRP